MYQTFISKKHSRAGFTLIETLVAVTILLIVSIGPMTIAQRGMKNAFFASDQTTAIYLAQEAIEHVQSLRDLNALDNFRDYQNDGADGDGNTDLWFVNLNANCKNERGCDVNLRDGSYRDCGSAGQCTLSKYVGTNTSVDRVYTYQTGADWIQSPYTRVIKVATVADGGKSITVTVSWATTLFGGSTRSVTLQTYLYDHYNRFR